MANHTSSTENSSTGRAKKNASREVCNKILNLSGRLSKEIRQNIRKNLRSFLSEREMKHSEPTITRYLKGIPKNDDSTREILMEFVRNNIVLELSKSNPHVDYADKIIRNHILELAQLRDRKSPNTSSQDNATSDLTLLSQIKMIFGMTNSVKLSKPADLDGKYFGYRRSTNEGDIIRFYIDIKSNSDGSLRFENRYFRNSTHWLVNGFGLFVDGITYLVGHAKSVTSGMSLGLRCFALVRDPKFQWLVGPVLSVELNNLMPIAARIVLIPANWHKRTQNIEIDHETIMLMIRDSIDEAQFDKEIIPDNNVYVTDLSADGVSVSQYVAHLMRNWTLTTLRGRPNTLMDDISSIKRMHDLERNLSTLIKNGADIESSYLRMLELLAENKPPS